MVPDVYDANTGAQVLGVNVARFNVLRRSDEHFPPALELGATRVYDGPALRAYAADRKDGRAHDGRTRGTVLREYRRHGVVARAARSGQVDPATAKRWLVDLGELVPDA